MQHPKCLPLCTKEKNCHASLIGDQVLLNNVNEDHHGYYKSLHTFNSTVNQEKSEKNLAKFPTLCLTYFFQKYLVSQHPKSHLFILPGTHCHRVSETPHTTLLWEKHGSRWRINHVATESFQVTSIKGQQSKINKNIRITSRSLIAIMKFLSPESS